MWLVVGLGNPGTKYILNRHNVGFMVADVLCDQANAKWKDEHKSLVAKTTLEGQNLIIAKPQTFMNRSGEAVLALSQFYKIPLENLVVVHDEIDIPFGSVKFQTGRGHGGQNGVRNIHELLGTDQYCRLKVGVGRPSIPQMNVADWVLQNFSSEDQKQVPKILEHCYKGLVCLFQNGYGKAASLFNKNVLDL